MNVAEASELEKLKATLKEMDKVQVCSSLFLVLGGIVPQLPYFWKFLFGFKRLWLRSFYLFQNEQQAMLDKYEEESLSVRNDKNALEEKLNNLKREMEEVSMRCLVMS